MGVVSLVGVREHAIREGGFDRAAQDVRGDDSSNCLAAIGASKFEGGAAGREAGARNHGGERVQDMLLGFLYHFVGQSAGSGGAHVSAELLHHRADAVRWFVSREELGGSRETKRKRCEGR